MYPSASFASNQLSDNRAKPINAPNMVEKKIAKHRDPEGIEKADRKSP